MAPMGPLDAVEIATQYLPQPELVGVGAVGLGAAVVGGRASGRLAARRLARSAADGYVFPMSIREERNVGRLERLGGVLDVPRTGSILALGASRSGKTEAAKHIVSQMRADENEPMVVYDHKDDYQAFLEARGDPFSRLSTQGSDVIWNVFREIADESDADEIARAIFADTGEESYFDVAARQVFAAVLKYLHREGETHDETPTNADLVSFFQVRDREAVFDTLLTYDDLTGAASHLDPDSSRQASGVYASVQQRVNDTFIGDFAAEGEFSIREYMSNPEGQALVFDYPYREGETTTPLFRLLVDLAAREALDDGDRGSYFVLDEVAQLPHLARLDELVNVGAGRSIQVLVTLQSVAQLNDGYGRDAASAILSGFLSTVLLRCGDAASVEFARERIGTEFVERTSNVEKTTLGSSNRQKTIRRETKPSEEYPFAKGDLTAWDPGEAVVVRSDSWAHGRVRLID